MPEPWDGPQLLVFSETLQGLFPRCRTKEIKIRLEEGVRTTSGWRGSLGSRWWGRGNRLSKNRPPSVFSGPRLSTVHGDGLSAPLKVSVGVEGGDPSACQGADRCCFHSFCCITVYVVWVCGVSAGGAEKKKVKEKLTFLRLVILPPSGGRMWNRTVIPLQYVKKATTEAPQNLSLLTLIIKSKDYYISLMWLSI